MNERLRKYLRINRAMDTVMWFATGIKHPSMYEERPSYHEYCEGLTSGFIWRINIKIHNEEKRGENS